MILEILNPIIGALVGGAGSALSKWIGIKEKKQDFEHEIKLLEMQKLIAQSETENELAIAQEDSYSLMRTASYQHDMTSGRTSRWVNNTLRLVRPILTLLLISLVWFIWHTTADEAQKADIISNVMFMASAALTWWFGDRSPSSKKIL